MMCPATSDTYTIQLLLLLRIREQPARNGRKTVRTKGPESLLETCVLFYVVVVIFWFVLGVFFDCSVCYSREAAPIKISTTRLPN